MKPPRPVQYLIAVVAVLLLMSLVLVSEGHCESVSSHNRWNWQGGLKVYGSGIAFDHLTTEIAKARGAYETNLHRQTLGGNLATDGIVLVGAMAADGLLYKMFGPNGPKVLRGAAVGIYATRGGLNLKVVW